MSIQGAQTPSPLHSTGPVSSEPPPAEAGGEAEGRGGEVRRLGESEEEREREGLPFSPKLHLLVIYQNDQHKGKETLTICSLGLLESMKLCANCN